MTAVLLAGVLLIAYGPSAVVLLAYASRRSALLILTIARCVMLSATPPGVASESRQPNAPFTAHARQLRPLLPPLLQRLLLAAVDLSHVNSVDSHPATKGPCAGAAAPAAAAVRSTTSISICDAHHFTSAPRHVCLRCRQCTHSRWWSRSSSRRPREQHWSLSTSSEWQHSLCA